MLTKAAFAAPFLALAIACTISVVETPTPRPTYTPYPTLTPEPEPAQPFPVNSTPTFGPGMFRQTGGTEEFHGDVRLAVEKAQRAFGRGSYQEALEDFLDAQQLHGRTSHVLQNQIGTGYLAMGQLEEAIRHFTVALEVRDTATGRVARGTTYAMYLECARAAEDAKAALAMEPATGDGIHTDVRANAILSSCYTQQGNYLQALQHADAALEIAGKYQYRGSDLETLSLARDSLQDILDGDMWAEDLLFEPAMSHATTGMQLLEEGDYEAAIESFEAARETHRTPSGAIQTMIGASHGALGRHEDAIRHHNNAVAIRDDAHHRVSRGNEYLANGRCEEAKADAGAALDRKPHADPGYHTGAEAHWILAYCLIEELDDMAALPHLEQALNLARANRYAPEDLSAMAETYENARLAVETGLITKVRNENIQWLQYNLPETAARLAQLPWVADGLAQDEQQVLDDLVQLMADGTPPEGPVPPDAPVLAILDMPFLRSIEPGDAEAVRSLDNIAAEDRAVLDGILGHSSLAGGITDERTPVIAVLSAHLNNPALVDALLDPARVRVESKSIGLPQTGPVELRIIRLGSVGNPGTMDVMEKAVRNVEFFMHLPLPAKMVAVLFADTVTEDYAGTNFGSGIAILPEYEDDQEELPLIMAHEVAHYYWTGNREWIDEGMAELTAAYHRLQSTGADMEAFNYPCAQATRIRALEEINPGRWDPAFGCNYSLGERLFLSLWNELGEVPFREGAQRLYADAVESPDGAGIPEVRAAFGQSQALGRWY